LAEAEEFIDLKEEGSRIPIFSGTLFRKENGREIKLIGYSRDDRNDLKELPLV
jgi:hypothetical protein